MSAKVNAMIIGAGRSGTTSLYHLLEQHPDICFSLTKEVHFFSIAALYARGEKYFHDFFSPCSEGQVRVTADTYLLADAEAPARIRRYNPDMRFLVMLRDPLERAFSSYIYSLAFGHEKKQSDFLSTIGREPEILQHGDIVAINNLCHFYGSLYHKHLSNWMQFFPREQFLLVKTSELASAAPALSEKIFRFLHVPDHTVQYAERKYNASSGVKSKALQQFLLNRDHRLRKLLRLPLQPFRKMLIRSGWIDRIYALNRKGLQKRQLTPAELQAGSAYFREDLDLLRRDFHITFDADDR